MAEFPWDYHSDLSKERLIYLGALFVQVRSETMTLHDAKGGDTPWSLGCRAYARTCTALARASQEIDWLAMLDTSLRCVFKVGSVPVRFYRGDPEEPNKRTLVTTFPELQQRPLVGLESSDADLLWRFALETGPSGEITNVTFIGVDEGANIGVDEGANIHCAWEVPCFNVMSFRRHAGDLAEGVDLPRPKISPKSGEVVTPPRSKRNDDV